MRNIPYSKAAIWPKNRFMSIAYRNGIMAATEATKVIWSNLFTGRLLSYAQSDSGTESDT